MTKQEAEEAINSGVLLVLVKNPSPGMNVPDGLGDPLILKFSKYYRESGVEITDTHIRQTLIFGGKPFDTHVPLCAITDYRIDNHNFQPASVPQKPALRLINGGKS